MWKILVICRQFYIVSCSKSSSFVENYHYLFRFLSLEIYRNVSSSNLCSANNALGILFWVGNLSAVCHLALKSKWFISQSNVAGWNNFLIFFKRRKIPFFTRLVEILVIVAILKYVHYCSCVQIENLPPTIEGSEICILNDQA